MRLNVFPGGRMQHRADAPAKRVLNAIVGVVHNMDMNDPQSFDIRRRIRELLAIPDRDRSDAEWDELNELEIRTAPGNRDNGYMPERAEGKRGFTSGRRSNHGQKNANANPRQENWQPQENRPEGRRSENKNRSPLKRSHRRAKPRPPGDGQRNAGNGGNGYPAESIGNGEGEGAISSSAPAGVGNPDAVNAGDSHGNGGGGDSA